MSFQQGLSGLNGASKSLDVIGNNVANASTVGFKSSETQFADVFAASLTGSGSNSVGLGVTVAKIAQQFTQGNISTSSNPLNMAINGGGFFRMSDNGAITYSRNGQFTLDKDGYVVNAQGYQLTGYAANSNGLIQAGNAVPLKLDLTDIAPQPTATAGAKLNLDSTQAVPANPFSLSDSTSYNYTTSMSVYDSQGNSHMMGLFYVKTGSNAWDVRATIDGALVNGGAAVGSLNFNQDGSLDVATSTVPMTITQPMTNGAANLSFTLNQTGSTQFGSASGTNELTQDGFTSGRLAGYVIDATGVIQGRYTNGQSKNLGQVALANFASVTGLQPLGNNQWSETPASGPALLGTPGTSSLGAIQSSATEDSNVDLTQELVGMITAQRVYQANAQTIKTQDQVLQTLVNLR